MLPPLKAYFHGSFANFERFDDRYATSVGHHFGDWGQAVHRIGGRNGFIYEVKLRYRSPLEVTRDLGWEHPGWTVKGLLQLELFKFQELVELQDTVDKDISIYLERVDSLEIFRRNSLVIDYLESKGFDSILYPNEFETPDGSPRRAICVFHSHQIDIVKKHVWSPDTSKRLS